MPDVPSRKLAVLVHADVVGSTALVQLDESLSHQRIQDAFRRFAETIAAHDGIAHEIRSDALAAEFARTSDAVSASTAFQITNTAHNEELPDEVRPIVCIGIAMGEVVIADNTITGGGVVLGQRLEHLADPVRVQVDWKYLLSLELTDAGFDFSVLSEFRGRLIGASAERCLLDLLLAR